MTITREILGTPVTIELTSREIYDAHNLYQHECDMQDCKDIYEYLSDEDIIKSYGVTRRELDDSLDAMATELRRNIDKYDMHWDSARDEAFSTIVSWIIDQDATALD